MKGDPCQLQACAIQKCLQAHKYQEKSCPKEFEEMRKCCLKWGELSGCCKGFKDPKLEELSTPKSSEK